MKMQFFSSPLKVFAKMVKNNLSQPPKFKDAIHIFYFRKNRRSLKKTIHFLVSINDINFDHDKYCADKNMENTKLFLFRFCLSIVNLKPDLVVLLDYSTIPSYISKEEKNK